MNSLFGICLQHNIPMRAYASEKAEMVSQVLFGETFEITDLNNKDKFSKITLSFDSYEGWIDTKTIHYLKEDEYRQLQSLLPLILHESIVLYPIGTDYPPIRAGAGSSILLKDNHLQPNLEMYKLPVFSKTETFEDKRTALESYSAHFLSVPYLWGGRSDTGMDCSGLVQNLYKQVGITIPRDASRQALKGTALNFLSEAKPGDLAFFDNNEGEITHVGMILPSNQIIHASGMVKIDKIDHQGIYSEKEKKYTHKLRVIRRLGELE